MIVRMISAASC